MIVTLLDVVVNFVEKLITKATSWIPIMWPSDALNGRYGSFLHYISLVKWHNMCNWELLACANDRMDDFLDIHDAKKCPELPFKASKGHMMRIQLVA